jgi:hypothetical protein
MLTYEILHEDEIIVLEPQGPLSRGDFSQLATDIDHYLAQNKRLRRLLVHSREFPGWEDLAGLMSHLRFVGEYHQQIERVALVSDSTVAALAPKLVELFINAEVENFDYQEKDRALEWLRSD